MSHPRDFIVTYTSRPVHADTAADAEAAERGAEVNGRSEGVWQALPLPPADLKLDSTITAEEFIAFMNDAVAIEAYQTEANCPSATLGDYLEDLRTIIARMNTPRDARYMG